MTPKNERFCQEFMIDLNATKAAIRCGYSAKTAKVQGSRLLTKVVIKSRIEELKSQLQKKIGISAESVVKELAKIGFSNIQEYLKEGNTIVDITSIEKEEAACVESIKTVETHWGKTTKRQVTIKLHSKVDALINLGRHLGIFETDNNQRKAVFNVTIDD